MEKCESQLKLVLTLRSKNSEMVQEFDLDDAKKLYEELDKIFGNKYINPYYVPTIPQYPVIPWWTSTTWPTVSGINEAVSNKYGTISSINIGSLP